MKTRNIKKLRAHMKRIIMPKPTPEPWGWIGITPTPKQFRENQKRGQIDESLVPLGIRHEPNDDRRRAG